MECGGGESFRSHTLEPESETKDPIRSIISTCTSTKIVHRTQVSTIVGDYEYINYGPRQDSWNVY